MDSIGFRIRRLREVLHFTQAEFAKMFGVTPACLSAIERGTRLPSKTLALFICDKTYVNRGWLIDGEGSIYGQRASRDEAITMIAATIRMVAEREVAERLLRLEEYSSYQVQEVGIMLGIRKALIDALDEMESDLQEFVIMINGREKE